jgi:hypothetical protein
MQRLATGLCIYLGYVYALTLSPFHIAWDSERSISLLINRNFGALDISLNTVGFLPFGFLLYFLLKANDRPLGKLCITASLACALSAIIEIIQLHIPTRSSSIVDVAANTVGAACGFVIGFWAHQRSWLSWAMEYKAGLAVVGLSVYGAALLMVFAVAGMPQRLDAWERGFPLLIGNEATLGRPWLGSIFSLLLFDRGLTREEIYLLYSTGPKLKPNAIEEHRPILAYLFDEGHGEIVHDRSQVGEALDVTMESPDRVAWLPIGALEIKEETVIRSVEPHEKIHRQIAETDAFSVSVWFQPASLEQHGPARIVSYSESPFSRNFTIGQEGAELHFRVRDLLSGRNGTGWDLKARALQSSSEPTHAIVTYDKGFKSLYVNGAMVLDAPPPDGLTLIVRSLHFDSESPFHKFIVGFLLIGGAGLQLWPLALKDEWNSRKLE